MVVLVSGNPLHEVLELSGTNDELVEYYKTLHKGDNITIESTVTNGSFEILRKRRQGGRIKFVLRRNEIELPDERLAKLDG